MYFLAPNSQRRWRKPANARRFALLRASMVVTYYIKLFCTGADRNNSILMSLLRLVAETMKALILHAFKGK